MAKRRVYYPPAVSRYYQAIFNPGPADPGVTSVLRHLDFRRPRRGSKPGTVSRYTAKDRALFPGDDAPHSPQRHGN
jgi:hypothetical protein